jgi:hypothetical protein
MRLLILVGCVLYSHPTLAFLGFSSTNVQVSYACLGLDGIPIADPTLASQCCDGSGNLNANASDVCRTSLYGAAISEPTTTSATSFSIAKQTLTTASQLEGAVTDLTAITTPSATGSLISSQPLSKIVSASVSDDSQDGTSYSPNVPAVSGGDGSGSGGGSSVGGGSVGTASGTGANVTAAVDPGAGPAGVGAYSANGGSGASGGGGRADGKKIGGLFGSLFGGLGSGSNKAGSGNNTDSKYGDATNSGRLNGKTVDGTSEDPADYFSRIDASTSLFKVVSNRYQKESSSGSVEGVVGVAK